MTVLSTRFSGYAQKMNAWLFIGCKESFYMVAPKYSRNHFISEKYKTVQSLKLHFLQNSPLVQLYTSDSDCKCIGNIPGSHFMKNFSSLPSLL
jgi:hypothetical protein